MTLQERIEALVFLGKDMQESKEAWSQVILQAKHKNPWFTVENCEQSIQAIAENYLSEQVLTNVVNTYNALENTAPKRIGVVAAGNIPLVGIHDIISCFLSGNISIIKASEKDAVFIPYCIQRITTKYPVAKTYFEIVERLENFDAVIATGSNNTSRYFEYYFKNYPHIIRKNRNALAVLSGKESEEELLALGLDIFGFFGLGCRNVSMAFVPRGYDMAKLMNVLEPFAEIAYHNKYKNNLDYNAAIYLLNKEAHLISDFLVMRESDSLSSRIACLHYSYYDSLTEVESYLEKNSEKIQCVVSQLPLKNANCFAFGQAQSPSFLDFADNVDTLEFLQNL